MRKIKINQVDAFTNNMFGGNPAGVVLNASELSNDEMQKIAREMNLSETAFILPSEVADFRLRYFTPTSEINFCGHATVGALYEASLEEMFEMKNDGAYKLKVETAVGIIQVEIVKNGNDSEISFESTPLSFSPEKIDRAEFAKKLGIDKVVIDPNFEIQVEERLNYIFVPILNYKTLSFLQFDFEKIKVNFSDEGYTVFCFYANSDDSQSDITARGLAPMVGVNEDPVTGSMQGGLAATLHNQGYLKDDVIRVSQGEFIGRPGGLTIETLEKGEKYLIKASAKHVFKTEIELD